MGVRIYLTILVISLTSFLTEAGSVPLPPTRPAESQFNAPENTPGLDAGASTQAGTPLPLCKGSDNKKWDNCVGTFTIENLGEYSGEIRGRKPEGSGVFRALDGSIYQGEFRGGVPAGKGRFTSAKGAIYIGEFADGVANGEGSEKAADGTRYAGSYINGVRDGKGHIIYPDGREYEGDFKADRIEGYGVFTFPNGDSYTGVFYNSEPTDRGILRFANGDRYVGSFKDFKPAGQGVLTFASGIKLIGTFANGKPQGPGVLYDHVGELIFEGELAGLEAIEKIVDAFKAKQNTKTVGANAVTAPEKQVSSVSSPPASTQTGAPIPNVSPTAASDTQYKAPENSITVSNIKIAPLSSDTSEAPNSDRIPDPAVPNTTDQISASANAPAPEPQPLSDVAPVIESKETKEAPPSQPVKSETTTQNTIIATSQIEVPSAKALSPSPSPSAPLQCKRGGDLLVSFITCEVKVPQIEIDDITFKSSSCRSGRDYLFDYDRALQAPWYDIVRLFKAYFYFRPFDYRGVHRYREEVHFLVSGCKAAKDFTIRVNGVDWFWPESGEPILSKP